MITVPLGSRPTALYRILTRDVWNNGSEDATYSGKEWIRQPMWNPGGGLTGFDVISYSRACLPEAGEAVFRYRYGTIDGQVTGSASNEDPGTAWDPTTNTLTVPDLRGHIIRIQQYLDSADFCTFDPLDPEVNGLGVWRTVWLGFCEYQQDGGAAASPIPMGERRYYCWDMLARTRKWFMRKHAWYAQKQLNATVPVSADASTAAQEQLYPPTSTSPSVISEDAKVAIANLAIGHPGYNVALSNEGKIRGTRLSSTTKTFRPLGDYPDTPCYYHTWPNDLATTWKDSDVITDALACNRPSGEPVFTISQPTLGGLYSNLLDGTSAWETTGSESVYDFIKKVLRRQRGLGLAFPSWDDTETEDPDGALSVYISVKPQISTDITYEVQTFPPGPKTTILLPGAVSAGTAMTMDLLGDHRVVADQCALGNRDQHRVDYLETLGEPIRVLATVCAADGSLAPRWRPSEAVAFCAQTFTNRISSRWEHVYQTFGLPYAWDYTVKDGQNGAQVKRHRIDYRCADNGDIIVPNLLWPFDTNPILAHLRNDIPTLEGYFYDTPTPYRADGTMELGQPPLRTTVFLFRATRQGMTQVKIPGSTGAGTVINTQLSVQVQPASISILSSDDMAYGLRTLGGISLGTSSSPPYYPGDIVELTSRYWQCLNTTSSSPGTGENWVDLGATSSTILPGGSAWYQQAILSIGIDLPHQVRYAQSNSGNTGTAQDATEQRRKLVIEIPNMHLWLASPGGIWGLFDDPTSMSNNGGFALARTRACGATLPDDSGSHTPGVLRDDRPALAQIHNLAWAWYGQSRRTARWAIKDAALRVPAFRVASGAAVDYPTLGATISTMDFNGLRETINTPVTKISYDHSNGITYWQTDWVELDFGAVATFRAA